MLIQVKGVGKCGYYRLWKEGMEDEDEEEEKAKKEVRYVRFKYGRTCMHIVSTGTLACEHLM